MPTSGRRYKPSEANPMWGFRGASRYYDPRYQTGFALECQAMRKVRDDMGLTKIAQFLVEQGIDSISLNPDAVLKTWLTIADMEEQLAHSAT